MTMANTQRTLEEAFPGRFLLGLGVSHHHLVDRIRHHDYSKPYSRMVEYLDEMDAAIFLAVGPTERPPTVLAALGPKMLKLAADRAAGAHPYFVPVEHTAKAREILGPDPILAPEQMVVLDTDLDRARATARQGMAIYLRAPNYVNNLKRFGFTDDDIADGGSDRLVDAIVACGDAEVVRTRVEAHFDAGADPCLRAGAQRRTRRRCRSTAGPISPPRSSTTSDNRAGRDPRGLLRRITVVGRRLGPVMPRGNVLGRAALSLSTPVGPPWPIPDELRRTRLVRCLAARWDRSVTLVVAGAGFGKSTALAQAVRANSVAPVGVDAWVGCQTGHEQAEHLAAAILAAIGTAPRSEDPVADVVDGLRRQSPLELCVVLDDVHEIPAGSSSAHLLGELVRRLPRNAHLVLAGRELPAIPLAHLRAADRRCSSAASVPGFHALAHLYVANAEFVRV